MTKPHREVDPRTEELAALRLRLSQLEAVEAEYQEATAALRGSEERFRALYENVPAMYFTLDADGTIVSVNSHGASELGFVPEDLVGESVLKVFHEDDRAAVLEQFHQAVAHPGQVARWEFRKVRKDGSVLWVEEAVRAIDDIHGRKSVLVVCEDVTWRKEAEQKLREQQAELEALTSQLLVTEERERRRIAEGIHDHIGQILAMAKMKMEESLPRVADPAAVQSLREAFDLVAQGIHAIRSFSFELSSPVLHELGLAAALQSLCDSLTERSGILFRFHAGPSTSKIDEDSAIVLFRVVRELALNVVKHASAREAVVALEQTKAEIRVTVRDDGEGFDAADATRCPSAEDGFGLFSIRKNLDLLEGSLTVESEAGRGTTVTAIIPRGRRRG